MDYMFINGYEDGFHIVSNAENFKEAIKSHAVYQGENSDIFFKALDAMETNEECLELYSKMCCTYNNSCEPIGSVYIIKERII